MAKQRYKIFAGERPTAGLSPEFGAPPAKKTAFKEGDNVVLAEGTYQGALGVFIRLRQDVNWAEIEERNGTVRCHPVVWLQHSDPPGEQCTRRNQATGGLTSRMLLICPSFAEGGPVQLLQRRALSSGSRS